MNACVDCGKKILRESVRCKACYGRIRVNPDRSRICKGCGSPYINKRRNGEGEKYCSRECYFQHRRDNPAPTYIRYTPVRFPTCASCGKTFLSRVPRLYCSEACRPKVVYYVPAPKQIKRCAKCDRQFEGNGNSIFCSQRCSRAAFHAKHGRDRGKYRKRARRAGVHYEPVNVCKVFERDGWRCQICGKSTPKERRGTNYPNAPELDHRIPLAKGGAHSYDNVQCACRACNGAKGAKLVVGQLPLLGAGGARKI